MDFPELPAEAPTDQMEVLISGHNRIFTDADGKQWVAYEVEGKIVPAARGLHCLVFECDTTIRRVWNYPSGWYELSAPELWDLSWGT